MRKFPLFAGIILSILLFQNVQAAINSAGNEFWLMFPSNITFTSNTTLPSLMITGQNSCNGTVEIPGMGFSQNFSVIPGTTTHINLPNNCWLETEDGKGSKGIHVTSSCDISVYGMWKITYTTDAYLGLPVSSLGNEYSVLAYGTTMGAQIGIAAVQNNTDVTIIPSNSTSTRAAGVPFTISLNAGESYQLYCDGGDLTGSTITSTRPIAVFGSNPCAKIPSDTYCCCDYIVEQLPPVPSWGTSFITEILYSRLMGDTFRILANTNNTQITINGSVVAVINKGDYYETVLSTPSFISASNPVLIAQYANSVEYDGGSSITADPFMMIVIPSDQFLDRYTVSTPSWGVMDNYINLIVPDAARSDITMNGTLLNPAVFSAVGTSGFSVANFQVPPGTQNITSSYKFGLYSYGFSEAESYGYPGGCQFQNVMNSPTATPTVTITLTPDPYATPVITPTPEFTGDVFVYPNPFNPDKAVFGKLKFRGMNDDSLVILYTVSGELVTSLSPKNGEAFWDATNRYGKRVSSGIYYYQICLNDNRKCISGKIFVVK